MSTTTQINRPSPYVEAFGKSLTDQVLKQIGKPIDTSKFAPQIVDVDPFTQQAIQRRATAAGLGQVTFDPKTGAATGVGAGTGIAAYQPFMDKAQEMTGPENRRPTENEIKRYLPFITKHIEIINPKILVLLGSTAMNALIGNDMVISRMRGKWVEKQFGRIKVWVIITFHPAFLMRQPAQKKMAWIDLKMIRDKKTYLKI